jgi:hypothetical protein
MPGGLATVPGAGSWFGGIRAAGLGRCGGPWRGGLIFPGLGGQGLELGGWDVCQRGEVVGMEGLYQNSARAVWREYFRAPRLGSEVFLNLIQTGPLA